MKYVLYALAYLAALILVGMAILGCQPHPSPQTAQKITTIQQQNQVDIAAELAAAKLAAQKAADNPVLHPITAANNAAKAAQKPLGLIATIAFLIAAAGVGLYFTPLSAFSKIIVPVAGGVAAFSFFGVIALPFFPWVTLGLAALIFGLFVYEIVRYKSLPKAVAAIESDLGFGSGTATKFSSTVAPILVQLTHN